MALPPPYMKARKRFGQNFLVNDYIINSIVDAINPQPGDYLVEIGPGHAALTRPVLERAKRLTAIELDRDLAERLRHDPFLQGLNLIEADALKVDFGALEGNGSLRVFGNLPYNITSPLLFHLLTFTGIKDLHFMLQKEVVERLAAGPGSKDYGRLTVMAQYHAHVIPVLTVPPSAFVPPPKVMSAVVRLKPKDLSPEERALAPFLNKITTTAFAARRKTIRNSLASLFSQEELIQAQFDLDARAEDLPIAVFVALAQLLQQKRSLEDLEQEEALQAEQKKARRLAKLSPNSTATASPASDATEDSTDATEASADSVAAASAGTTANAAANQVDVAVDATAASAGTTKKQKQNYPRKPDKRKMHHKFDDFDFNDINADI